MEGDELAAEAKKVIKKGMRMRKILIVLIVVQHVLFAYGIYKFFIGDMATAWFHIIINGVMIPLNFRSRTGIKRSINNIQELEKIRERMGNLTARFDKEVDEMNKRHKIQTEKIDLKKELDGTL